MRTDALGAIAAADELPRQIIGHWCLTSEAMLPDTYGLSALQR
jgi:hypothetical protein